MAKSTVKKTAPRKTPGKRANAPMKNTAKEKPVATTAKADSKKAARTAAKTVKADIRKSTAKRVEKTAKKAVKSAAELKRIEDIKGKANGLILCIKQDAMAAAKGEKNSMQVQRMFKAMMVLVADARKDMGKTSK